MPAISVKSDFQFTAQRGTTFGTPQTDAPIGLPIGDMDIKMESTKHTFERARGIRVESENDFWVSDDLSIPEASFKSAPLTPDYMVLLLPGILQKTTDWTPAGNIYTMYTIGSISNVPSFTSGSQGYFYTLVRNNPLANRDVHIASAVPHTMKLMLDVKDNNSVLSADMDFVGRGFAYATSSGGSVTHLPLTTLYKFQDLKTFSYNSVSFLNDLVGFEIEIKNGAKFANDVPLNDVVLPKFEVSGKFKILASSNTEILKQYCHDNTAANAMPLKIYWGDGTVSSAGELNIDVFCYLTNYSATFDEGEVLEFEFVGKQGLASEYPIQFQFYV